VVGLDKAVEISLHLATSAFVFCCIIGQLENKDGFGLVNRYLWAVVGLVVCDY